MSRETVLRWSGAVAVASGVVLLALALGLLAARAGAGIPDLVLTGLRLGANILIVLALAGIFYALSPWSGKLGQAGIVLVIVGSLLSMTGFFPLAGSALLLLGLLLCAIACTHAGLRTGPGLWLWLIGASVAFAMGFMGWTVLMSLGVMISACGRMWLGSSARHEMPALGRVPSPKAAVPAA